MFEVIGHWSSVIGSAVPQDSMISGNWIIAVIGAVAAGIALVMGKAQGRKEERSARLEPPVPEVPTRKVSTPPSWDAHRALCDRVSNIENDIEGIRREMKEDRALHGQQFRDLMLAGGEREIRITEKIEGFANAIHRRIDDVITQPKRPGGGR